jgi:hypothetical protein
MVDNIRKLLVRDNMYRAAINKYLEGRTSLGEKGKEFVAALVATTPLSQPLCAIVHAYWNAHTIVLRDVGRSLPIE